MSLTMKLMKWMDDPAFADNGCDNPVFRFREPNLVPAIYKEHVEGWWMRTSLTVDERTAWQGGMDWLRSLEDVLEPRLFGLTERLEVSWWDAQAKALVSRRATPRRINLPLGKELDVYLAALLPHAVVWHLGLVDEKHIDLTMHPKIVLQRIFYSLRKANAETIQDLLTRCYDLYPKLERTITEDDVRQTTISIHLNHWPGLRLCPPFFPDRMALQPAPSLSTPRRGKYVVLHACLHSAFATTSVVDASTCSMDRVSLPVPGIRSSSLTLKVTDANELAVFQTLSRLNGMHPRSFQPAHDDSPFAAAAQVLVEWTDEEGTLKLPEQALGCGDTGFSFTYMPPKALDDTCVPWERDEEFYEVVMPYQGQDHFFHVSAYVGWGLRLRKTLLSVAARDELKGRGVCVVVPEGLDQDTMGNVLLTCVGWLRDLRLSDVKLVSETTCQAMCIGSLALASRPSVLWASVHDGRFVCQAMGGVMRDEDHHHVQYPWHHTKYRTEPLKPRLMDKLTLFLLDHNHIKEATEKLVADRFKARAWVVEGVAQQLPTILAALDHAATTDLAVVTCTLTFPHMAPVVIDIPLAQLHDWLASCFDTWTAESWWPELREQLDACQGIVVSGGVFDCCPHSALRAWLAKLNPIAQQCTTLNRLHVLHGACMHLHATNGYDEMVVRTSETVERWSLPSKGK